MDMTLIQGTISGLKLAGDIAQGFLKLNTLTEVQGKVIELQSAILSAQSSALSANADQAAMIDEIRLLKEEIARVKAWETQKQRYQLEAIWDRAALVYALKKSVSGSEPPHWICTKCYEDGLRMILQPRKGKDGFGVLACPTCKSELHSRYRDAGQPSYSDV